MRAAIIGSGAAAASVLQTLRLQCPNAAVSVFDQNESSTGKFTRSDAPEHWPEDYRKEFFAALRQQYGFRFPPPKTNFGLAPARRTVENWGSIWHSRTRGGLTNYWGASTLPFSARELRDWPISAAELRPYYRAVADRIGIAGEPDSLEDYFGETFVNRPPIGVPAVVERLREVVNTSGHSGRYDLIAGASRLALETRPDHPNGCRRYGLCMTGCPSNSLYSARSSFTNAPDVHFTDCEVISVDLRRRVVMLRDGAGESSRGPFDRVYICAGCAGSTEILLRSMREPSAVEMTDNSVSSFPILYLGTRLRDSESNAHFALTNLLMGCIPTNEHDHFAQIQIYLSFDYLWQYFVPVSLWRYFAVVGDLARARLLWGRLYLHGDHSQRYSVSVDGNSAARFALAARPKKVRDVPGLWDSVRKGLTRAGFWVPPIAPLSHSTSSHYAASFPMGGDVVGKDGEVAEGIYLCDSAAFPNAPAPSLTFTVMANAARIAHRSVGS